MKRSTLKVQVPEVPGVDLDCMPDDNSVARDVGAHCDARLENGFAEYATRIESDEDGEGAP